VAGGAADCPTVLVLPGATMVPAVCGRPGPRPAVPGDISGLPPAGTMADLVAGICNSRCRAGVDGARGRLLLRRLPGSVRRTRPTSSGLTAWFSAQSGVRHFVGPVPLAVLHALLRVAPARLVRSFSCRGFAATAAIWDRRRLGARLAFTAAVVAVIEGQHG
jgi:hypothetical protein